MRLRGRMERAAVERREGRLQFVDQDRALAMGIGGQKGIVGRAEQPHAMRIRREVEWKVRLETVAVWSEARHRHHQAIGIARIARTDAALHKFRLMLDDEPKSGPLPG